MTTLTCTHTIPISKNHIPHSQTHKDRYTYKITHVKVFGQMQTDTHFKIFLWWREEGCYSIIAHALMHCVDAVML